MDSVQRSQEAFPGGRTWAVPDPEQEVLRRSVEPEPRTWDSVGTGHVSTLYLSDEPGGKQVSPTTMFKERLMSSPTVRTIY